MKILHSWLREFVDTPLSAAQVQEALTMAGVEVSGCRFLGQGFDRVVTARILAQGPHPRADKLSLCRVTDGTAERRIVCGARNMKPGDAVALALPGARLPNGGEIGTATIRGEVSEGMLCSEQELGLAESSPGIMILPPGTAPGIPLADALGLSDWLLEVEVTPNRGDCLSVLGVAREVAALAGGAVRLPETAVAESGPPASSLAAVRVTDPDLCPRYSARVVTGLAVAPSPPWMQRRLSLCGIRPINNVVDVTNYLLLELGQPMHAFDLDRLRGAAIDVRRSGVVRRFTTLDGVEREIPPETLLIWDAGGPVAVAGIMGGQNTEVLPSTGRVLFESAHFAPLAIRRSSRRLGLSSESSYRFERGVDPAGTAYAAERAVALLSSFSPLVAAPGTIDVGRGEEYVRPVPFRPARVERIIGRPYGEEECRGIFARLSFPVRESGPGLWTVEVPARRFDIEREIDLVEEIARLSGYDTIPTTYPESGAPDFSADDRFTLLLERAAEVLRVQGFSQAINFAFVPEKEWRRQAERFGFDPGDAMRIANPLSDDATMMRPHLLGGLLRNVAANVRRFAEDVRLFEIGKAFGRSLEADHFEEPRLAFVLFGRRLPGGWSGQEAADFHDAKGAAETLLGALEAPPRHYVPSARPFFAPGKGADILVGGEAAGWIGAVHRELVEGYEIPGPVLYGEIRLKVALGSETPPAAYRPVPKFPPVIRDYACVLPEAAPVGDVLAMVREVAPEVESAQVFDVYTGEQIGAGRKSIAFRLRLQGGDRTLTEAEANSIHTKIVKLLENRFGGQMRGS